MLIEERNYLLVPGGAPRYLKAWYDTGREPQVRHLGEPLGVHVVEVGDLNTLVYWWRYDDLEDRSRRRTGLAQDAEFAAFRATVRDLLVRQSNRILLPARA